MTELEPKARTKTFALRIVRMVGMLPRGMVSDVPGRQIVRSATSVAANYRSVCRAKSRADFIAKLGLVEGETDETGFWLEMIADAGLLPAPKLAALQKEADELTAIFLRSLKTTRDGGSNPKSKTQNPE